MPQCPSKCSLGTGLKMPLVNAEEKSVRTPCPSRFSFIYIFCKAGCAGARCYWMTTIGGLSRRRIQFRQMPRYYSFRVAKAEANGFVFNGFVSAVGACPREGSAALPDDSPASARIRASTAITRKILTAPCVPQHERKVLGENRTKLVRADLGSLGELPHRRCC